MPTHQSVTVRELILLTLISENGPICAYYILHTEHLMSRYFSNPVRQSTLYHSLHKLYRQGLTISRTSCSKNAPDRILYTISAQGKRVLYQETGNKIMQSYQELFSIQNKYREASEFLLDLEKLLRKKNLFRPSDFSA